jgi:hypothetical protein
MGQTYVGAVGRTRTATVHVVDSAGALVAVQVYVGIDAVADPALAEQLRTDALNVVHLAGGEMRIAVPVVYHDAAAGVMVLVLDDAHRHREIDERIRLLEQLRDDIAEVPPYAKDFAVVFGAEGLRAHLDDRARRGDLLAELGAARVELARLRGDNTDQFIPVALGAVIGSGAIDHRPGTDVEAQPILDDDDDEDSSSEPMIEVEREIEADAADDVADQDVADQDVADQDVADQDVAGDAPQRVARADSDGGAGAPMGPRARDSVDAMFDAAMMAAGIPIGDAEFDASAFDDSVDDAVDGGAGAGARAAAGEPSEEPPDDRADRDSGEVPFDENSYDAEISGEQPLQEAGGDAREDGAEDGAAKEDGAEDVREIAGISAASADADGPPIRDTPPAEPPTNVEARPLTEDSFDAEAALEEALEAETGVDAAEASGDAAAGAEAGDAGDAGGEGEASGAAIPLAARRTARLTVVVAELPEPAVAGVDPVTAIVRELPLADAEPLAEPGWRVSDGGVQLAIAVDAERAAALSGTLDLRLVLHRAPTAPVIALVIGSPAALRAPRVAECAVVALDVATDRDREVLRALGRGFDLGIDLVSGPSGSERTMRRCRLSAPLADNVSYLVQAADEHLHEVTTRGAVDHAAACELVLGPEFDLLGAGHPERSELRTDRLAQIATAQQLRRALAIARRFTQPALEDYLVCTRGFPLARWHQLRRKTVARAVAWGIWMGHELAQIAVSEGFARSRRDLILRLDRGFEKLRHDPQAFDIDAEATADNAAAIAEQARAFGVVLRPTVPNDAGAIASDRVAVAAGSIETSSSGMILPLDAALPESTDELLAMLDGGGSGRDARARRLAAAQALCDRGDPRAARPVIAAALQMSRGEAVRVLARVVKLGAAAHPALIEGLASSKAYLRHGCALALALSRAPGRALADEASQAVVGLLLSEPTDLWHEIAGAVGEIGAPALAWLVRDLGSRGPAAEERIAWAMAHIAASGSEPALTAMAATDGAASRLATRALALHAQLRGAPGAPEGMPEREASVNHAFSRQFFEALDQAHDRAGAAPAAVES